MPLEALKVTKTTAKSQNCMPEDKTLFNAVILTQELSLVTIAGTQPEKLVPKKSLRTFLFLNWFK